MLIGFEKMWSGRPYICFCYSFVGIVTASLNFAAGCPNCFFKYFDLNWRMPIWFAFFELGGVLIRFWDSRVVPWSTSDLDTCSYIIVLGRRSVLRCASSFNPLTLIEFLIYLAKSLTAKNCLLLNLTWP